MVTQPKYFDNNRVTYYYSRKCNSFFEISESETPRRHLDMVSSQGAFRLILVTLAEKIDLINKADGVFNVQIQQQSTCVLST
jgi:hypothetical protein